jgi:hypothetical protein
MISSLTYIADTSGLDPAVRIDVARNPDHRDVEATIAAMECRAVAIIRARTLAQCVGVRAFAGAAYAVEVAVSRLRAHVL